MFYLILFTTLLFNSNASINSEGKDDLLLQKLVNKGIISQEEAGEIKDQQSIWIDKLKPSGDFRFRFQDDNPIGYGTNRDRVRIRLRGRIEPKITEDIKVGVGLATGFNNNNIDNLTDKDIARSTNQTLGDGFSKKSISLELGYAEYTPVSWFGLVVGKFKNPIWEPGDLIWDTDINPEGVALKFKSKLDTNFELFGTTDVFSLEEKGNDPDIIMYTAQAGFNHNATEKFSYKVGFSYYGFSDLKGKRLDGSTLSNSINNDQEALLLYNYNNIIGAAEFLFKNPFNTELPLLSIFIEYVTNANNKVHGNNKNGYMIGTLFGSEKLKKLSDWQIKYNYALLEKDSILDILPDSDRYSGKTNMRAHELAFNYALGSSNWIGLDFYYGEQLKGPKLPATVLQLDWNLLF